MNAENPVQIDLFGVSATRTKDTRLAEHIGGYSRACADALIAQGNLAAQSRLSAGESLAFR